MVQACQVNLWLAEGNLTEAQTWAQTEFPQIPFESSFGCELNHICLSRVLVASKRWDEALDLLQRLSHQAEAGNRFGRLLKINILRAQALDGLTHYEEAFSLLENCLHFAQAEGYIRSFLDEGAQMRALIWRGKLARGWQELELSSYIENLLAAF